MYNNEWLHYVHQLHAYLQAQNIKIEEMRQMIQKLLTEMNNLKEQETKPAVTKNEYKFDLLKIEKLEGTLNIGLNPNGKESSIDEFSVGQSMQVPPVQQNHTEYNNQRIQEQIFAYLDKDAYQTLRKVEQDYAYPLDDPYRKFIVDDVKRQINQRIQHYVQKTQFESLEENQRSEVEQEIVAKVRKDIDRTFEAFIQNLPRRETKSE